MTENTRKALNELLERNQAKLSETDKGLLQADFPDLEWRNDFLDIFGLQSGTSVKEFAAVGYSVESDTQLRFEIR